MRALAATAPSLSPSWHSSPCWRCLSLSKRWRADRGDIRGVADGRATIRVQRFEGSDEFRDIRILLRQGGRPRTWCEAEKVGERGGRKFRRIEVGCAKRHLEKGLIRQKVGDRRDVGDVTLVIADRLRNAGGCCVGRCELVD